jgi:carbon-monoxide dehydrogenase medium subunit
LVLTSATGERRISASQFFLGPGQTTLKTGEFLTAIQFPVTPSPSTARYLKLGRCKSGDLSLVGVAIMCFRDPKDVGHRFRIGLGSVAPTAIRVRKAEEALTAARPTESAWAEAAEQAVEASCPITDVRGTAAYQRAMVRTLTLRGLREVWAEIQEEL